jgi:hypothetical protein
MKRLIVTIMLLLGLASMASAWGYIWIDGYQKQDGSYTRGHWRTTPDEYRWNNLGD